MNSRLGLGEPRKLPHAPFDDLWDRIILPEGTKESVVNQILLELTVRGNVPPGAAPLHGLLLLTGPPGTGKTSLARAAPSRAARALKGQPMTFVEVEPHSLTSSAMGKTQKRVHELFMTTIRELAANGPLVVLLDEAETLAADRQKLSLEANPIDIHRATDAVLASLDQLAQDFPQLLFIATTNFEKALDGAFASRADYVLRFDRPDAIAREAILRDTFAQLGQRWPQIGKLAENGGLKGVVEASAGLDGRQLRKVILQACATDRKTALDPNKLGLDQVVQVLRQIKGATK